MPKNTDIQDPFDALGLPPRFDLEIEDIERAYLARAAALHPDLASGDAEARELGERASAALNGARRVLRNAERRAGALLSRLGAPDKGEDRSLPDGFLIEILEVREQVESAQASGDPEQVARWEAWGEQERARYTELVSGLFGALGEAPAPEALREIRTKLNAWRYIERLIEQLDPDYNPSEADFAD